MPTDLARLQGTWHITALENDGLTTPPEALAGAKVVIKRYTFESLGMGAPYEGTFELDEAKTPKRLDLIFSSGHAAGTRRRGIYRIDRDGWTLCLATEGTRRPATFATKPGSGFVLEKLERAPLARQVRGTKAKPVAPAKRTTSTAAPTELEGEWPMVSAVFNGAPMDPAMVAWCKRVTTGHVTSVVAGPKTMLEATFTLDASTTPRAIDYVNVAGAHQGKSQAGIYRLQNGTLEVCMARPGDPRPRDFASKPGDGRSFTTWRAPAR